MTMTLKHLLVDALTSVYKFYCYLLGASHSHEYAKICSKSVDVLIKKNPGQNREDLDLSQGTPQSFVPQGKDQMRVRLRLTSN